MLNLKTQARTIDPWDCSSLLIAARQADLQRDAARHRLVREARLSRRSHVPSRAPERCSLRRQQRATSGSFTGLRTSIEETMQALDDAVGAGKILYVGISDTPAWVVASGELGCRVARMDPFAGVQVPHSLLRRDIDSRPSAQGGALRDWPSWRGVRWPTASCPASTPDQPAPAAFTADVANLSVHLRDHGTRLITSCHRRKREDLESMRNLEQTSVLITGGNKGLGLEAARRLGELGWTVFLGSRDEAPRTGSCGQADWQWREGCHGPARCDLG